MKIKNILNKIESFAPSALAYSWDNVGLLVGDGEREAHRIMIALDPDLRVVEEAVEKKCDLIVSHHPMFFKGLKRIEIGSAQGKAVELMMKNDISLIAAHTNMDCAKHGINAGLAELFDLKNVIVLEENPNFPDCGLGRVGDLPKTMSLTELAQYTKKVLNISGLRFAGDTNVLISRIAVAGGSCSEVIPLAVSKGAQAIVTGDMKYHETIDAVSDGICVIDAGHYGTERHVVNIFKELLSETGAELVISVEKDIFLFA